MQELQAKQCQHLIVFPLFPQFSSSATESALEEVRAKSSFDIITIIDRFYGEPNYIESMSMVAVIRENLAFQPDFFI